MSGEMQRYDVVWRDEGYVKVKDVNGAYVLYADAQRALDEEREKVKKLREALVLAKAHVDELRDAWERGAISEHDMLGGTRSNRNIDVCVKLFKALTETKG